MSLDRAAAQLLIRLQLTDPEARVFCVTQPRGEESSALIAGALAAAMNGAGAPARVVFLSGGTESELSFADVDTARRLFHGADEASIVVAGDLLEAPRSLIAASAADLVVLVARRGKTRREDIDEARRALEAAGARLAAAMLLD